MLSVISAHWWGLLLLGLAAGTLGALLGVGGGIIMVPVMVLILALPQKAAQGVSLTVMIPMAIVAATRYWMGPHMNVEGFSRSSIVTMAVLVGVGAVTGAFVGSYLSGRLPNQTLRIIFGVFMILVGVYMLASPWLEKKPSRERPAAQSSADAGVNDNARYE